MNCLYEFKGIPQALTEGETANQKGNPIAGLVLSVQ